MIEVRTRRPASRAASEVKPVSGRRMCKILEDRGWSLARVLGSHHAYEHANLPGHLVVPRSMETGTSRPEHSETSCAGRV